MYPRTNQPTKHHLHRARAGYRVRTDDRLARCVRNDDCRGDNVITRRAGQGRAGAMCGRSVQRYGDGGAPRLPCVVHTHTHNMYVRAGLPPPGRAASTTGRLRGGDDPFAAPVTSYRALRGDGAGGTRRSRRPPVLMMTTTTVVSHCTPCVTIDSPRRRSPTTDARTRTIIVVIITRRIYIIMPRAFEIV